MEKQEQQELQENQELQHQDNQEHQHEEQHQEHHHEEHHHHEHHEEHHHHHHHHHHHSSSSSSRKRRKRIWLSAGKPLDRGTTWAGVGFVAYLMLLYNEWDAAAWCTSVIFGLFALYVFISAAIAHKKKKESVSYSQLWGTFALAVLMLGLAAFTAEIGDFSLAALLSIN